MKNFVPLTEKDIKNENFITDMFITDMARLVMGAQPMVSFDIVSSERQQELKKLYQQKKLLKTDTTVVTDRCPTDLMDKNFSNMLEELYQNGNLKTKNVIYSHLEQGPSIEYEYDGKKFVRVVAGVDIPQGIISNEEAIKKGDACYFAVTPLEQSLEKKRRRNK